MGAACCRFRRSPRQALDSPPLVATGQCNHDTLYIQIVTGKVFDQWLAALYTGTFVRPTTTRRYVVRPNKAYIHAPLRIQGEVSMPLLIFEDVTFGLAESKRLWIRCNVSRYPDLPGHWQSLTQRLAPYHLLSFPTDEPGTFTLTAHLTLPWKFKKGVIYTGMVGLHLSSVIVTQHGNYASLILYSCTVW